LVEHLLCKQRVRGSSPLISTIRARLRDNEPANQATAPGTPILRSDARAKNTGCSGWVFSPARGLKYVNVVWLVVLLDAVPSTWPMYQARPDHDAVFRANEPAYRWRYDAGAKINGGLAISGNVLYAETFAPEVIALDRRSGRLLWSARMPNTVMTTPVVADGLVIVGTGKDAVAFERGRKILWGVPGGDQIVALDARTGAVRWRYKTPGEDMPSPALVRIAGRDAIVFANGDDHVRALSVRSGRLLWITPVTGVSTMASAAAVDGLVYVLAGTAAGSGIPDHVYAVRASDGSIVWRAPFGNADDSPTVANGRIFVEDGNTQPGPAGRDAYNQVFALDAKTGRLLWSYTSALGGFTRVGTNEQAIAAFADRGVLFQSLEAARRFAAFDVRTGRVLWSIPTQAAVKMSGVAKAGRIYVGDTAGVLYMIDEGTGRVLARRKFPLPFTCSSPVIVGSTLYVADGTRLFALPLKA
jgi:outer membrane protein assembly factor BamB